MSIKISTDALKDFILKNFSISFFISGIQFLIIVFPSYDKSQLLSIFLFLPSIIYFSASYIFFTDKLKWKDRFSHIIIFIKVMGVSTIAVGLFLPMYILNDNTFDIEISGVLIISLITITLGVFIYFNSPKINHFYRLINTIRDDTKDNEQQKTCKKE